MWFRWLNKQSENGDLGQQKKLELRTDFMNWNIKCAILSKLLVALNIMRGVVRYEVITWSALIH